MTADAITAIQQDHRLLEDLFEQLKVAEPNDRMPLVEEVTARLEAHARAEEQEVYPAITKAAPDEEEEVEHAYHEHVEAMHKLRKVRNLVDSPHFEQALDEFVAAVRHHVEEEESEVLPTLGKATVAGREGGIAEATRDELYEMAKEAEIPGRSSMNKEELAEALRGSGIR